MHVGDAFVILTTMPASMSPVSHQTIPSLVFSRIKSETKNVSPRLHRLPFEYLATGTWGETPLERNQTVRWRTHNVMTLCVWGTIHGEFEYCSHNLFIRTYSSDGHARHNSFRAFWIGVGR